MTRVSREHPGLVLMEEYHGAEIVWVTPEPPWSGVLGGWKVHASVVNNPMCHGSFCIMHDMANHGKPLVLKLLTI